MMQERRTSPRLRAMIDRVRRELDDGVSMSAIPAFTHTPSVDMHPSQSTLDLYKRTYKIGTGRAWQPLPKKESTESAGLGDMSLVDDEQGSDPYDYQDNNQERVIHSGWDTGNNYRFILEGTGDIFRELCKSWPDMAYINEKVRRIERHIKDEKSGDLLPEQTYATARKDNGDKFERMIQQWKMQPVENEAQEMARQLNLHMLVGEFDEAAKLLPKITAAARAKSPRLVQKESTRLVRVIEEAADVFTAPSKDDLVARWLQRIGATKNADGSYNVRNARIDITSKFVKDGKLIVRFNKVGDDFFCYDCGLTSLEGAPQMVAGNFGCAYNKDLTSLKGGPQKVLGYFNCRHSGLTTPEGAPREVGGSFIGDGNVRSFTKEDVLAVCKVGGNIYV